MLHHGPQNIQKNLVWWYKQFILNTYDLFAYTLNIASLALGQLPNSRLNELRYVGAKSQI